MLISSKSSSKLYAGFRDGVEVARIFCSYGGNVLVPEQKVSGILQEESY